MSSKTKFTPGPWVYSYSGDGKAIEISDCGDDTWEYLRCFVDSDDCDRDMAEANANLIVAAPELYEALAAAESLVTAFVDRGDGFGTPIVNAARAALAKARGES